MLTTLNLDDKLLAQTQQLTGLTERTQLIRKALLTWCNAKALAVWHVGRFSARVAAGSSAPGHQCMMLVDTSVWIDYLRWYEAELVAALLAEQVLIHSWVIGELACGTLQDCSQVLVLLQSLPVSPVAGEDEVLYFN